MDDQREQTIAEDRAGRTETSEAEVRPAAEAARLPATRPEPDAARPPEGAKKRRSRLPVLMIALLVLGAASLAGWQWWTAWRFVESTDDAYLHADMSVISPEIAGYVQTVPVADNQAVEAGDVLATIDDRDYAAKVAAAEADLNSRHADVAGAERQITLQASLIAEAEAAVTSAEADIVQAQKDHDRYAALSARDFASRQSLENATAALARAEAAKQQASAAVAAARDRLPVLQAALDKAKAGVAAAEAALATAKTNLERTVIRAPVDGVVGNKGVRIGEFVQPGRQLMAVVPIRSVYVVANFKETQLAYMQPGQAVAIEIDAFPDQPLEGHLDSFAPGTGAQFSLLPPENATGNFTKIVQRVPVKITLPADSPLAGKLRPGLSVVASIDTKEAATATAATEAAGGSGAAQAAPVE